MPGSFTSVFLVAFRRDAGRQLVRAFEPRLAESEPSAVEEARALARDHAGVLVYKRVGNPVVGEEGDPEIVFRTGEVGDFD